ncbi:SPFH domain-containing protein [Crocinitomicaceae bacterium]|nr:SPFH domain-containing protein [Crocinitomicaceae bacterium]MDC1195873.1 SPFH domain-containing protein [Crocinitomicaceae bacterium]|tara:strand:+ start:3640 stop:5016 length:1377 start_codon:yes stop_codon:yes gene_type:complete
MGLFGKKEEGGLMDVIRCDEQEYLVWKWRPSGEANSTKKENAIRYGSSLRVKDGEMAVFVYKQEDGPNQDFIEGPHDQTIKTANFPILSKIVGLGFGGGSPFQAEIYFVNLSGNVQIRFGIPYFDVFDPRFADFAVPMAVRGTITFNITDVQGFIKLNRLINFELDDFKKQIKDAVTKYIKGVVTNIPADKGMPVLQMERKILEINDLVAQYLKPRLEADFGVNMKGLDIADVEADKEAPGYAELRKVTAEQTTKTVEAQTDVNITNLQDTQRINAGNMEDTLRIQREEMQRAQKLQTEGMNMGAHQLNQQTDVAKTAAESMGKMGSGGSGGSGGGGMDPGSMMASMAMGGAVGGQMAGAIGGMMGGMNEPNKTPPPTPEVQYSVSINGEQGGPFGFPQLQQMVQDGQLTKETHVWKQGMSEWALAGTVQELSGLFAAVPPPPPPPPGPPTPPAPPTI